MYDIKVTKVTTSRASAVNFENIPMGVEFSDYMFICDYEDGRWINPRIEPLANLSMHPAAMALHYGQAIFEGMKATKAPDGTPMIFRADDNAHRMNVSARRMGMPEFPEDLFVEALRQYVELEHQWIPSQEGSALYLRPFMFADEPFIGMRAATKYKFMIIASPAGPFFSRPIKLYAETQYIRAAVGGTGEAKAAGNYAAAILPTELAKKKGYDQVLWLDPEKFEYVQEVGTMNIFFKIGGKLITPDMNGAILNGITRLSVIELLRDKGFEVEERPLSMNEVLEAFRNGTLEEAFGVGTAVSIALIEAIEYRGEVITFPKETPVANDIKKTLDNIKTGKEPDKFGWMMPVTKVDA